MLLHWPTPRTASSSAARSSGPIGAVATNASLDRTSSYSRKNALPIDGPAAPVRHGRKTSRAAREGYNSAGFAEMADDARGLKAHPRR